MGVIVSIELFMESECRAAESLANMREEAIPEPREVFLGK